MICGLTLGKPIGIVGFSWLAIRLRFASLPEGVVWRQIIGAGVLAGIGFTMSFFIADLAFSSSGELEIAKVGILAASVVAGITGTLILVKKRPGGRSVSLGTDRAQSHFSA